MLLIVTKVHHCANPEEPPFSYECICEIYMMLTKDNTFF